MIWLIGLAAASEIALFASDPVRPIALTPSEDKVLVANLPDGRLEVLDAALTPLWSVPVGLDPVAVAAPTDTEAWVVNHVSDSVSVVDLTTGVVTHTWQVGDAPRDIVFARGKAFVTTAHRGQHAPYDPWAELDDVGAGRTDVWVLAPGEAPVVVTLPGDTPRALATDGDTVWVGVYRSGNQTTTVHEAAVCDGPDPCTAGGRPSPGGLPGPTTSADGTPRPETGLIVAWDGAAWRDELGRDWTGQLPYTLPDRDVFAIDAATLAHTATHPHVGTVLYALAADADGVYVAHTDAVNAPRFVTAVRGHLHESRLTRLGQASVHLNPHIDYAQVPSPAGTAADSLALPTALALDDGTLWVAGYGSAEVRGYDRAALDDGRLDAVRLPTGGGPAGLAVAEAGLYVYARFDHRVALLDRGSGAVLAERALFSPEPAAIERGRAAFFDARLGSSNGEQACGSCHVHGDVDGLAWDLGDPAGVVRANPNPLSPAADVDAAEPFHPMMGPMVTQTMRGIADAGPMHWRGDRIGSGAEAFVQFSGAFTALMGAERPPPPEVMQDMAAWALAVRAMPNPHAPLDGAEPARVAAGRAAFVADGCIDCHALDPIAGHWGTDGTVNASDNAPQMMKIPALTQVYRKVGFFHVPPAVYEDPVYNDAGEQVRGYGLMNDGAMPSILTDARDFLLAFPGPLAPIVGQQVTATTEADAALLLDRAEAGDCALVAHRGDVGWLWDAGAFVDEVGQTWTLAALLAEDTPLTLTCAVPGTAARLAWDRDGDGLANAVDPCPADAGCPAGSAYDRPDTESDTDTAPPDSSDEPAPCGCQQGSAPGWLALFPLALHRRRRPR